MLAVNTHDTPLIVDGEGRVLPGGERGEVDPGEERVASALASGRLLEVAEQAKTPDAPAAQPAEGGNVAGASEETSP